MKIEYKDIPELLNIFKSYWASHYHIKFTGTKIPVLTHDNHQILLDVIDVKVNDTNKGGEGNEAWTLEYAEALRKSPKEMEICIKRWHEAFKVAKRNPTLDILGHKNVTIN